MFGAVKPWARLDTTLAGAVKGLGEVFELRVAQERACYEIRQVTPIRKVPQTSTHPCILGDTARSILQTAGKHPPLSLNTSECFFSAPRWRRLSLLRRCFPSLRLRGKLARKRRILSHRTEKCPRTWRCFATLVQNVRQARGDSKSENALYSHAVASQGISHTLQPLRQRTALKTPEPRVPQLPPDASTPKTPKFGPPKLP